ncbi:MAG: hypothetical protein L3J96_06395, partial [Thermoplasmata archaeon]|nr:hypothetical protein [Thermoplasmata archaeon]
MAAAVLVRGGTRIHWMSSGRSAERSIRIAPTVEEAAEAIATSFTNGIPSDLRTALAAHPPRACLDPALSSALRRIGTPLAEIPLVEERAARESAPPTPAKEERELAILLARRNLDIALRSPEETLISLAREEERVERALRREEGAAEQFLTGVDSPLQGYVEDWGKFRERFAGHHSRLLAELERTAEQFVPNLSSVVGPRVAARLVSHAPGLAALARMSASRLHRLGSRRRPSTSRGPRFGLIYRGARLTDVPADRVGAYARSLAALAVVAARADWSTQKDVSTELVARRDRRV